MCPIQCGSGNILSNLPNKQLINMSHPTMKASLAATQQAGAGAQEGEGRRKQEGGGRGGGRQKGAGWLLLFHAHAHVCVFLFPLWHVSSSSQQLIM